MADLTHAEPRQPFLHDLILAAAAPSQAWLDPHGRIEPGGLTGFYDGDVRVLSQAVLTVAPPNDEALAEEPEVLACGATGSGKARTVAALRMVDGPGADPTTVLVRELTVTPGLVAEHLELSCSTPEPVRARVSLRVATDLARMEAVKTGKNPALASPAMEGDDVVWTSDEARVRMSAPGAEVALSDDGVATISWDVTVVCGQPVALRWEVASQVAGVVSAPATPDVEWSEPQVPADADPQLKRLVSRALADLATLRMTANFAPDDVFLAAGAPWFFTLFGRDSIWAARLLLPLGPGVSGGTLRTLAARQGQTTDLTTGEEPGKVLHELRAAELHSTDGIVLPPLYYGTVDATPLWICLLVDAWRAGLPDAEVRALLPNLRAALGWMRDFADHDGDGFLDYLDPTGRGLSNQGWKDSGDSIQWRDGTLAAGPIALAEVQAYAYEAAMGGAALLEAVGADAAEVDGWRAWAAELQARFRSEFWLSDDAGPYLAIALDRHGKPVDSVASNMGHVVGTGILTAAEEAIVAARLVAPDMSSGFGLRTMSTTSAGYWPLGYHRGSVWAHDTAITITGLRKAGFAEEARTLALGLLAAAPHFDYQLPELFGGFARDEADLPVPYPASCRLQAWSAGSAIAILEALR